MTSDPIPSAAVVLAVDGDRVLALTRGDDMADWHLPGGKLEDRDYLDIHTRWARSPEAALVAAASRELREETGLRYDPIEMDHLCDFTSRRSGRMVRAFRLRFIPPAITMRRTEAGSPGWVPPAMLVQTWCTFREECAEVFRAAGLAVGSEGTY